MLIPKGTKIDWNFLLGFKEKLNLILMFESINEVTTTFPWFWGYPVTTWFELDSLLELKGLAQVIIGGPLFFDLEKVYNKCQTKNVKIRVAPNLAYDAYIPRRNGIIGTYIRPEDISIYESYIDLCFFRFDTLAEEKRLFMIYHDDKTWPGNLELLIKNLGYSVDNRGINSDFAERRLTCRQSCCQNGLCHYCETYLSLINTIDKHKTELQRE